MLATVVLKVEPMTSPDDLEVLENEAMSLTLMNVRVLGLVGNSTKEDKKVNSTFSQSEQAGVILSSSTRDANTEVGPATDSELRVSSGRRAGGSPTGTCAGPTCDLPIATVGTETKPKPSTVKLHPEAVGVDTPG